MDIAESAASGGKESSITPSRIFSAGANAAAAAGSSKAAFALKTAGNILSTAGPAEFIGGAIGGKIGFQYGGQAGAAIGLRIGYGLFGSQGIMPGVTVGYFTGAIAGGLLGAAGLSSLFKPLDSPSTGALNYGEAI